MLNDIYQLKKMSDTASVSHEITLKAELHCFYIKNNYVAVRQNNYINNVLDETYEYITDIKSMKRKEFVKDPYNNFSLIAKNMPMLYNRAILSFARNAPFYDIPFDQFLISNPYEYLTTHSKKENQDVVLLFVDKLDYHIFQTDGKELPTAVYIDPSVVGLTEDYYNIDKVGYMLLHRRDVYFIDNEGKQKKFKENEKENMFTDGPSHYEPSISIKTIHPFIWIPNDSDFKKILEFREEIKAVESYKSEYVDIDTFIINDILGLSSAKKYSQNSKFSNYI